MKKLFFTLCLCILPASISHAQAVISGKIRITPIIDVIAGAERNDATTASVWVDAKNQHSHHQGNTNAIDDTVGGKGGSTDKPTVSKTPIIDVIIDENQQPENNGGTQKQAFQVDDIAAKSAMALSVFPNPAADFLYVSGLNEEATIVLYDMQGKQAAQFVGTGNSLDISELQAGCYIVHICNHSTELWRGKLQKVK